MVKAVVSDNTAITKKTKLTKGRLKIEMKKIEESNKRQVAFSKRRTGLFKKASELCVLTGAEIAILVSSPGGRVFTFGHPSPDVLVDRYLDNNTKVYATAKNSPHTNDFNQRYMQVSRDLEAEKKREETIPVSSGGSHWYNQPADEMDAEEYLCSMEEFKKNVLRRADELKTINNNASALLCYNNIQPVDIHTNATVDGGFHFQKQGMAATFNYY